jgi:hypothetical protein
MSFATQRPRLGEFRSFGRPPVPLRRGVDSWERSSRRTAEQPGAEWLGEKHSENAFFPDSPQNCDRERSAAIPQVRSEDSAPRRPSGDIPRASLCAANHTPTSGLMTQRAEHARLSD